MLRPSSCVPEFPSTQSKSRSCQPHSPDDPSRGSGPVKQKPLALRTTSVGKHRDTVSAKEVLRSLALSVEYVFGAGVDGEIAEFGTMTGSTARCLAEAIAKYEGSKRLLLFDSFEGLPEAASAVDKRSLHVRTGVWGVGDCHGVSSEQLFAMCRKHLAESQIVIYEGWFADTLQTVAADTRFALLHIDSDLYQSALDVLDHCFSRGMIARGAVIHFDDWDCNQADPSCGERRAWADVVEKYGVEYSDCGQYGWGSRKFIVHSYRGLESDEDGVSRGHSK